jgi:rhodanese-related sulfurtransferase
MQAAARARLVTVRPWEEARKSLKETGGVTSVPRERVERFMREGMWRSYEANGPPAGVPVLLDVRRESAYAAEHLDFAGALSVPLFTEEALKAVGASGLSPAALAANNNFAFRFFSLGTTINPSFVELVLEACEGDKDRPVFVMCARGGDLDGTNDAYGDGTPSHSLVAIDELRRAGFTNLMHVKAGYYGTPEDALCESRTVPSTAPHKVISSGLLAGFLLAAFAPVLTKVLTTLEPADIMLGSFFAGPFSG